MKMVDYVIVGRVQGVGFRYKTRQVALNLNLTGYVKNRLDGCVEVRAEGKDDELTKFELFLHKGPVLARVVRVELHFSKIESRTYRDFIIEY